MTRIAFLAMGLLSPLAIAQTSSPERIAGTVTSAADGRPLPRATVVLQDSQTSELLATTLTGPDGAFRFVPMSPGRYQLLARAHGFVTSSFLEHEGFFSAVVTGKGLPVDGLKLQLAPTASIHGRVLDENGEPNADAFMNSGPNAVHLYRADESTTPRSIHSYSLTAPGADGSYEFTDLAPGTYFLTASAQPWYAIHSLPSDANEPFQTSIDPALDVVYPLLFYPAATTEDGAQPIVLKAGDSFFANFQMLPEHALSLVLPPTQAGSNNAAVNERGPRPQLWRFIFGEQNPVWSTANNVNGTNYLLGLAPGQYTLSEQRGDAQLPTSIHKVTLADRSLTLDPNLFGASAPTATVTLRAHNPDGSPATSGLLLQLQDQDSSRYTAQAQTDPKGTALFPGIPSGTYKVQTSAEHAVLQLSLSGPPLPDHRLRLAPGVTALTADLTIAPVATIQGFVASLSDARLSTASGSGNKAPAAPDVGSMVLLVPAGGDRDPALFRRDQTDLDGGFTLHNVAPGNYLLLALDNGWSHPWTDLHWLGPYLLRAIPIHISAASAGTVRLPTPLTSQQVP